MMMEGSTSFSSSASSHEEMKQKLKHQFSISSSSSYSQNHRKALPLPPDEPLKQEEIDAKYPHQYPSQSLPAHTEEEYQSPQQNQQQQQKGGYTKESWMRNSEGGGVDKAKEMEEEEVLQEVDLQQDGVLQRILVSLLQFQEREKLEEWLEDRIGWRLHSPVNVCEWTGIECDPFSTTKDILELNLAGTNLVGTIPKELGYLDTLITLDLSMNHLHGTLPRQVLQLPNLVTFNVARNDLDGTLPSMTPSHLNYFGLGSSSSSSSASLQHSTTTTFTSTSLQKIALHSNRFQGTIPDNLIPTSSISLMVFDVSHNAFDGTIPSTLLTSMPNVNYFDISFNKMEGSIPPSIGDLKNLQGLFVNNNELMGTIPPKLTREDMKIVQLFLQHNRLSGTIPASLTDLQFLESLFVDGNKFTGTVPKNLCDLPLNEEFFATTETDYDHTTNTFKVNSTGPRNGCTTISCPTTTVGKEGVYPCYPCNFDDFNPYLGQNDKCFNLNDGKILDLFYKKTNGPNWALGSNAGWGLTQVPHCKYDGVKCNGAGHVINITLVGQNLQGTIPAELGFLQHLQYLDLSDNQLTGYLPSDLRFAPLEYLDVSGNQIRGFVPPMLCLTGDINGNGVNGMYTCDIIACSEGSWSPIGRSSEEGSSDHYKCKPCIQGSSPFLGSKTCNDSYITSIMHQDYVRNDVVGVFVGIFLSAVVVCTMPMLYRNFWCVRWFVELLSCKRWSRQEREGGRKKKKKSKKKSRRRSSEEYSPKDGDSEPDSTDLKALASVRDEGKNENGWLSDDDPSQTDLWLDVPKIT